MINLVWQFKIVYDLIFVDEQSCNLSKRGKIIDFQSEIRNPKAPRWMWQFLVVDMYLICEEFKLDWWATCTGFGLALQIIWEEGQGRSNHGGSSCWSLVQSIRIKVSCRGPPSRWEKKMMTVSCISSWLGLIKWTEQRKSMLLFLVLRGLNFVNYYYYSRDWNSLLTFVIVIVIHMYNDD